MPAGEQRFDEAFDWLLRVAVQAERAGQSQGPRRRDPLIDFEVGLEQRRHPLDANGQQRMLRFASDQGDQQCRADPQLGLLRRKCRIACEQPIESVDPPVQRLELGPFEVIGLDDSRRCEHLTHVVAERAESIESLLQRPPRLRLIDLYQRGPMPIREPRIGHNLLRG